MDESNATCGKRLDSIGGCFGMRREQKITRLGSSSSTLNLKAAMRGRCAACSSSLHSCNGGSQAAVLASSP